MEIATIINVHNNPVMARDTIDSVRAFIGNKILLIVDEKGWSHYADFKHPDTTVKKGVYHGAKRSPYKNLSIAMMESYKLWPNVDWYMYIEFDVLIISPVFKEDLIDAMQRGVAAVGVNHCIKSQSNDHWMVKEILYNQTEIVCHKLLGAVMCYSNRVIRSLVELDFFDDLLERTKAFKGHDFPDFTEYAVEEILFPSAASVFGPVENFKGFVPRGNKYPVRFAPEVLPHELSAEATIAHPIKDSNNLIRQHYANTRGIFLND